MRRFSSRAAGFSLTELMVALTVSAVVLLIGWATWEMGWRETWAAHARAKTSRNTFAALQTVSRDVMRAQTIEVPDPGHTKVDSIQVSVLTSSGLVRRAYRLEGDALIVDRKDEGVAPYEAFDGISALSFKILDAPTNGMVEISCALSARGRTLQMQTVAQKRN